jgi:hypothetical protein
MRDTMPGPSREAADRFFKLRDERFIAVLRAGDRDGARARSQGPMRFACEEHRRAIDQVVRVGVADVSASETSAAQILASSYGVLSGLALACVVVVLLIAFAGAPGFCTTLAGASGGRAPPLDRRRFGQVRAHRVRDDGRCPLHAGSTTGIGMPDEPDRARRDLHDEPDKSQPRVQAGQVRRQHRESRTGLSRRSESEEGIASQADAGALRRRGEVPGFG